MTTEWLLMLLLFGSSHSVDSQPTTDDQVCDGEHWRETERDITLQRILINQDQLFQMLNHQQQQLLTIRNRLGYASCKEIRDSDNSSASGEYTIRTITGRILDKVYCEMGLNGGGYTFLNPKDLANLTNDEVQAMFTDKNSFLMRVRRSYNVQAYGVLAQLPKFQTIPLKLGLNEHTGYAAPENLRFLGPIFLYYGFIPLATRNHKKQGLQVNGRNMTFTNCGPEHGPNSYIALFPNFANRSPSTYTYRNYPYRFCINLFNSLIVNPPSNGVMPQEYFVFLETHWGGCGCFAQTDSRGTSVSGTLGAAIGFR